MMTIVTHVHLKEGAGREWDAAMRILVCPPRRSDRVGWEDNSSGHPISQTGE
jgi:hypothetical protein